MNKLRLHWGERWLQIVKFVSYEKKGSYIPGYSQQKIMYLIDGSRWPRATIFNEAYSGTFTYDKWGDI